jgi:hypothetical protein
MLSIKNQHICKNVINIVSGAVGVSFASPKMDKCFLDVEKMFVNPDYE